MANLRIMLELVLVLTSVIVLFLGLAVMSVGLWADYAEYKYLVISDDDPALSRIPQSLVVLGLIVAILAVMGVVGTVLARNIFGRILLGAYTFVLALVIASELGSGAAAIQFRGDVERSFISSADRSLGDYNDTEHDWNHFQSKHHCCGSWGYKSYFNIPGFPNGSVPESCCNLTALKPSNMTCEEIHQNVTGYEEFVYNRGCPAAVIDIIRKHLVIIAAIVITISLAQIIGVVAGCLAVYLNSREEKIGGYKYTKMRTMT